MILGVIRSIRNISSADNIDEITEAGIYSILGNNGIPSGSPVGYGILEVIRSPYYHMQRITQSGAQHVYIRVKVGVTATYKDIPFVQII